MTLALALHGGRHEVGKGHQRRCDVVGLAHVRIVHAQIAQKLAIGFERHGNEAVDALQGQDVVLFGRSLLQPLHLFDDHGLMGGKSETPPIDERKRQILQQMDFRLDARRAPLCYVVHPVFVDGEHVGAVSIQHASHQRQRPVDGGKRVFVLREALDAFHDRFARGGQVREPRPLLFLFRQVEGDLDARFAAPPRDQLVPQQIMAVRERVGDLPRIERLVTEHVVRAERTRLLEPLQHAMATAGAVGAQFSESTSARLVEVQQLVRMRVADVDELRKLLHQGFEQLPHPAFCLSSVLAPATGMTFGSSQSPPAQRGHRETCLGLSAVAIVSSQPTSVNPPCAKRGVSHCAKARRASAKRNGTHEVIIGHEAPHPPERRIAVI